MSDISHLPCCTCRKCTCNVTQKVLQMQQDQRLLQFMMKLNEKFSTVRGNILMQQPLPSLSNEFIVFCQEERHQELSQATITQTDSLAFVADGKRNFKLGSTQRTSYVNNGRGNPSSAAIVPPKKGNNYFCTNCKIPGHTVYRCFKIHGYPPNFKNFRDKKVVAAVSSTSEDKPGSNVITVAQYQQLMDLLNKQSVSSSNAHNSQDHALLAGKMCLLAETNSKSGWLIDSGATDHICCDLNLFSTYKHVSGPIEHIVVPDVRQIPILHIGTVQITTEMVLHNVLHIPDFHYNLISVQRLCKDLHCSVIINEQECVLQGPLQKKESTCSW